MIPDAKTAESWLEEARRMCLAAGGTDGWVDHSRHVAEVARAVASACSMDSDAAYAAALLHDCGRRDPSANGVKSSGPHSMAGYSFMMEKGAPEVARICITHSFLEGEGVPDCELGGLSDGDGKFIRGFVADAGYGDFDFLIQLADNMALKEGYVMLEQRIVDLMHRYPGMPEFWLAKFRRLDWLKRRFERMCGKSVYSLVPGFMDGAAGFRYDYLEEGA